MKLSIVTPPASEPITLSELKLHLRLDSGTFGDNVDSTQSIPPGGHGPAALYSLAGASVEVTGYSSIVILSAGTNGATGTVDVKIQESDDNATWTDWTGGAFTQVTVANDNETFEKSYTGAKRYIRTVAQVALASCDFGTSIVRNVATSAEDDLLNAIITSAREHVEDITRRQLITATYDYFLDHWPTSFQFGTSGYQEVGFGGDNSQHSRSRRTDLSAIHIPFGNLQSVASVKYKDTSGTETTMVANTDYIVETNGEQHGRLVLPWAQIWPPTVLFPSKPIAIRFTCGWASAALVPYKIKAAVKMIAADLYENRTEQIESVSKSVIAENVMVGNLLASSRLWGAFP